MATNNVPNTAAALHRLMIETQGNELQKAQALAELWINHSDKRIRYGIACAATLVLDCDGMPNAYSHFCRTVEELILARTTDESKTAWVRTARNHWNMEVHV